MDLVHLVVVAASAVGSCVFGVWLFRQIERLYDQIEKKESD